jgi:fucose 4-O-acetylase-like acetyltransferase
MSILADRTGGNLPRLRATGEATDPVASERESVRWVTIAKGVAILLMVYCHVWRGISNAIPGAHSPLARACDVADAIIYAFHMPLFFFLSGMFVERSVRKSSRSFFDRKLRTIVYPYVVWSVLQCLVASAGPSANRPMPLDALRGLATRPYMQFWFLYVLVLCMVSYWVIHALRLGAKAFLLVTVLAYTAGPFVHLASYGRVLLAIAEWPALFEWRSNALYFALGAFAGPWLLRHAPTIGRRTLVCVAVIGLGLTAAMVLPVESEAVQYRIAPAAAVVGMSAAFAVSIALAARRRPVLESIGEATLPIFAAHVIFAAAGRTFLHRGLHAENIAVHLVAGTLLGVTVPMALRSLAARAGLPLFSLTRSKPTKQPAPAEVPEAVEAEPMPEGLSVSNAA